MCAEEAELKDTVNSGNFVATSDIDWVDSSVAGISGSWVGIPVVWV